jgi:hypothetical protein
VKATLILCIIGLMALWVDDRIERAYQEGAASAINSQDPSPRLEAACLSLWVGEQNHKWQALHHGK